MNVKFSPLRFLTRGFGGPAAVILTGGLLTFPIIVDVLRREIGNRSRDDEIVFDDDVNVYKITAVLREINSTPLNNVIYNKMTKLIVEKRIDINAALQATTAQNTSPYKIVIGDYKVVRQT
jgi:hypothetical protein